jgi:hypothetical protein
MMSARVTQRGEPWLASRVLHCPLPLVSFRVFAVDCQIQRERNSIVLLLLVGLPVSSWRNGPPYDARQHDDGQQIRQHLWYL